MSERSRRIIVCGHDTFCALFLHPCASIWMVINKYTTQTYAFWSFNVSEFSFSPSSSSSFFNV